MYHMYIYTYHTYYYIQWAINNPIIPLPSFKEFARLLLWRSHKSQKLVLSVIPEHVQDVLLSGGLTFFKEDGCKGRFLRCVWERVCNFQTTYRVIKRQRIRCLLQVDNGQRQMYAKMLRFSEAIFLQKLDYCF